LMLSLKGAFHLIGLLSLILPPQKSKATPESSQL